MAQAAEERKQFRRRLKALARPDTSPDDLRRLGDAVGDDYDDGAYDVEREIQAAAKLLNAHPNIPLDVLATYIYFDPDAFLQNPILPLLPLEAPEFFENLSKITKLRLLTRAATPLLLVRLFAASPDSDIERAAKEHLTLTGEAGDDWEAELQTYLETLPLRDTHAYSVMADLDLLPEWLAKRVAKPPKPMLPPRWMQKVSVPKREYVPLESPLEPPPDGWKSLLRLSEAERIVQARNPFLPEEALLLLAQATEDTEDEQWLGSPFEEETEESVRCAVAQNPAATGRVLELCAKEHSSTTDLYIAVHPAAPTKLLIRLCKTSSEEVKWAILSRSSLPPTLLKAVASPLPHNLLGVLQHPSARQNDGRLYPTLRKVLVRRFWEFCRTHSEDPLLKYFALLNADLYRWQLPRAAKSSQWLMRLAAAQHPKTSSKIRERLAEQDGNRFVRAAARASIAARAEKASQSTVDA
jgi:hypothetical protein